MAKTVVNARIADGTPYTVPAGKYAVVNVFSGGNGGLNAVININSVQVVPLPPAGERIGPFALAAGNVMSVGVSATTSFSISGFLYDA